MRLDGDHHVGELPGDLAGLLTGDGDADRHPLLGQVPELRRLDVEVLAAEVGVAVAVEELADDPDRLDEHLLPDVGARPAAADDVLVEVLPRAEAEGEPAVGQDLQGRGLLGDRRVGWYRKVGQVT